MSYFLSSPPTESIALSNLLKNFLSRKGNNLIPVYPIKNAIASAVIGPNSNDSINAGIKNSAAIQPTMAAIKRFYISDQIPIHL